MKIKRREAKEVEEHKNLRPTAVDVVVIEKGAVLLIKRGKEPFKGKWCLPGGFVEENESVEQAAEREVKEETGIDVNLVGVLGVYSDPNRDERHTVSIAFLAFPKGRVKLKKQPNEVKEIKWFDISDLPPLGFDHCKIVRDAIEVCEGIQCRCEQCTECHA